MTNPAGRRGHRFTAHTANLRMELRPMQEANLPKSRLLEDYRQPDGQLNLDRLGDDLSQDVRRIMREAAQTLRALYPPRGSRLSLQGQRNHRPLVL